MFEDFLPNNASYKPVIENFFIKKIYNSYNLNKVAFKKNETPCTNRQPDKQTDRQIHKQTKWQTSPTDVLANVLFRK